MPLRAAEHHHLADGGQLGADGGDALGLLRVDEHHGRAAVGDHVAHLVGGEAVGQRHGDQARLARGVQRDEHLDAVGPAPDHRVAAREAEAREAVRQPVGPGLQLGEREPLPLGVEHRERVGHQRGLGGEGVGSGHDPTLARPVDNSRDLSAPRATLDAMTALPVPLRPLTAAEYAALPEDSDHDYELQDGHVIMSAKPIPDHQHAVGELYVQLQPQIPEHLKLLLDVDLDMELVPPTQPGTVRVPDLVVVTREASCGAPRGWLPARRRVRARHRGALDHHPPHRPGDQARRVRRCGDRALLDGRPPRRPGAHRLPPRRPVRLRRRAAGHGHLHHPAPVPGAASISARWPERQPSVRTSVPSCPQRVWKLPSPSRRR